MSQARSPISIRFNPDLPFLSKADSAKTFKEPTQDWQAARKAVEKGNFLNLKYILHKSLGIYQNEHLMQYQYEDGETLLSLAVKFTDDNAHPPSAAILERRACISALLDKGANPLDFAHQAIETAVNFHNFFFLQTVLSETGASHLIQKAIAQEASKNKQFNLFNHFHHIKSQRDYEKRPTHYTFDKSSNGNEPLSPPLVQTMQLPRVRMFQTPSGKARLTPAETDKKETFGATCLA